MDWTTGQLAEGLRLYNAGEFFAAHEVWESVWLESQGTEKTLLQGVIQVAAAFHHYHRNNREGTASLLQAALRRLESPTQPGFGISLTLLCSDIRECLQALSADDPKPQLAPPRILPS